ncbi:MAG: hypothetical protein ABR970_18355, partial [Roseiarcus sp.]
RDHQASQCVQKGCIFDFHVLLPLRTKVVLTRLVLATNPREAIVLLKSRARVLSAAQNHALAT